MLKNKILITVFFIFFIIYSNFSYGQNTKTIDNQIDAIVLNFQNLQTANTDADINLHSKRIDSLYLILLSNENSFNDSLSKLSKYSSILTSDDKKIRIITWNIFLNSGEYFYYGYIQFLNEDNNKFHFVKLFDESQNISNPNNIELNSQKWYGCLYYKIIETKHKKNRYYTLLGWDGNNFLTNKKIIEVLTIKNDKPKFGFNFEILKEKRKRIIFEYNAKASMTLRWDENKKLIIWDHLAPTESKYEGMPEFYGPDFTNDALKFKKGKWILLEDIDIKNPKN